MQADYALIKAWKADKSGNLVFKSSARNFNPDMAMACKETIVEVEEIVEDGELHPDHVHLSGIYVHKIVKADPLYSVQSRIIEIEERKKLSELSKAK